MTGHIGTQKFLRETAIQNRGNSMKNNLIARALMVVATCMLFSPNALADARDDLLQWIEDNSGARKYTPDEAMNMLPPGPNPYLSFRPAGAKTNASYWDSRKASMAAIKAAGMPAANVRVQAKKNKGTVIKGFGTGPSQTSAIDVFGNIDLPPPSALVAKCRGRRFDPIGNAYGSNDW